MNWERIFTFPLVTIGLALVVGLLSARFPAHKEALLYGLQFLVSLAAIHRVVRHHVIGDRRLRDLFLASLGAVTFGDACYYLLYYLRGFAYGSKPLFFFSILPYCASYVLGAAVFGLLLHRGGGAAFLRSRIFWFTAFLCAYLGSAYVLMPGLQKLAAEGPTVINLVYVMSGATTILLGPLALFTVISSRDIRWAFIALGYFGFVVLDWGIKSEILAYGELRFSLYDLTWFHSVLLIAAGSALGGPLSPQVEPVDLNKLTDSIRFYPTIMMSIPALFVPSLIKTNVQSVVVIIMAFYFLLFLTLVISEVVNSRIEHVSHVLTELSQRSIDNNSLASIEKTMPKEFQDIVSSFLSVRVIERKEAEERAYASAEKFSKSIGQLVHDLQSPIAALQAVARGARFEGPEELALVGASFARLDGIISETLEAGRKASGELSDFAPIFPLRDILLEKSILLKDRRLQLELSADDSANELTAKGSETELARIVSNLIDNAVQAVPDGGTVRIELGGGPASTWVEVSDTGRGIPAHIVDELGKKPVTFGKDKGNGLGLYHCFTSVRRWGGEVRVRTSQNGTTVRLELMPGVRPDWLALSLPRISHRDILVVDDSKEIVSAWQLLIANRRPAAYFRGFTEALRAVGDRDLSDTLILSDFDVVGDSLDGIDFFDALGGPHDFMIVTGKYFLPDLRKRCLSRKIKILPKHMLGALKLNFDAA